MHIIFAPELNKELQQIIKRDRKLAQQIHKQLQLFSQDPFHPSLRIHKLTEKLHQIWSLSITMKVRMLYFLNEDEAYFFDIGTHDQVYK